MTLEKILELVYQYNFVIWSYSKTGKLIQIYNYETDAKQYKEIVQKFKNAEVEEIGSNDDDSLVIMIKNT